MRKGKQEILALASLGLAVGALVMPMSEAEAAKTKVESVKVKAPYGKQAYIAKGKSIKLSASGNVIFASKNKKIATVTKKGVVKAKKVGKTKIVVMSKKNKKKKTTITLRVVKRAVKKVTLSQKKVSLSAGSKTSLKAKVTAKKGASKGLYWKSSKTSVVSVSQKGVVTAKKAGTATITVQATDGSKKKATCKVEVTGSANTTGQQSTVASDDIVSVKVMNANSLTFTLARSHSLGVKDVVVKTRMSAYGSYQNELNVGTVYSDDGLNYTVVFSGNSSIGKGEYVQVTIPGLAGVKQKETQFFLPVAEYVRESIFVTSVGKETNLTHSFDVGGGYTEYTVTGLPDGYSYEERKDDNSLWITGTATTAGAYEIIISATDEQGNHCTSTYHLCVGDTNAVVATTLPIYCYTSPVTNRVHSQAIIVAGGSGEYVYTMEPNAAGITLHESGWIRVENVEPGDYTVTVQVADAANPALTTSVTTDVHVRQGYKVSGTVRDALGNPITKGVSVSIENCDLTNRFFEDDSTRGGADGTYTLVVPAGAYNICVTNSDATVYKYECVIGKDEDIDISLPVYPETSVETQGQKLDADSWNAAAN